MNSELIKAYHEIIKEEARLLVGLQDNKEINEGEWYPINNYSYYLYRDELVAYLRKKVFSEPENIINTLLKQGFLVQLPKKWEEPTSERLRSLHMDVLVRSSHITTQYGRPPYLLSYKFAVSRLIVPSKEDRIIIPNNPLTNDSSKKLWHAILFFFENNQEITNVYVNIIKKYLGDSGLDSYQAYVLRNMLQSLDKNTYAIIAPTGSGKTEIYLFYTLATIIKWQMLDDDRKKKAILVYPRKTLTIDQTYRIVRLLSIANQYLRKYNILIRFVIRDGDTPHGISDIEDGSLFRGINCPFCKEKDNKLVFNINKKTIECKRCRTTYEFIIPSREEANEANLIATNPWALETRILDSAPKDINAETLSNTALAIFDEVHEYSGLSGGMISSLIEVIRCINYSNELKLVFSSATVPEPKDFIMKLSGNINCDVYSYEEIINNNKNIKISGERLMILGYFMMNPQYSWNTYCQLWSVLMAFLGYAYQKSEKLSPQSILFINNIKELRRVKSGYIENLSLGEPKDHLKNIDSIEPYAYWHYLPFSLRAPISAKASQEGLSKELESKIAEMYSELPKEKREETANKLRGGEGLVVLSTSSLELGVDYDGVSFVLNSGLDNPVSLIQRIGRGGRSDKTLRTVLGMILARAVPTEILKSYDLSFMKALAKSNLEGYKLFVTKDNPQIIKRRMLIEAISRIAKNGENTYASGGSGGPIKDTKILIYLVEKIKDVLVRSFE